MTEYIDKEVLLRDLERKIKADNERRMAVVDRDFIDLVNDATVVEDVVEVVRCKDCPHLIKEIVEEETSYGFTDDHEVFGCGRILELTGKWVDVFLDDFCSYGERKE